MKTHPKAVRRLSARLQIVLTVALGLVVFNAGLMTQSRAATLPEVPTVIESGVAGYDVQFWYGVFAPAATPKDIVAKLSQTVAQAVKEPSLIESLAKQGVIASDMTPQQFAGYVKAEVARWGKVVKESGAKVD